MGKEDKSRKRHSVAAERERLDKAVRREAELERRIASAKAMGFDSVKDFDSWEATTLAEAQEAARAEEEAESEAEWRRRWYEKADAEARAKGFASYEQFAKAEAEKRAAKAAEPMPYDWREDTR